LPSYVRITRFKKVMIPEVKIQLNEAELKTTFGTGNGEGGS